MTFGIPITWNARRRDVEVPVPVRLRDSFGGSGARNTFRQLAGYYFPITT
jgi:hypothetical protein